MWRLGIDKISNVVYIWRVQGQSTAMAVPTKPNISNNFVGTFSGISLVEDPETGFLTSPVEPMHFGQLRFGNGTSPLSLFSAFKKLKVIDFLKKRWNVSAAMSSVGLSRGTFNNHYAIDEVFRECVDDVREHYVDRIDEVRFEVAEKPSGSFDRMCVLNAHRRETYNPKTQIQIEHTMPPMMASKRDMAVDRAVDAEIVETVKRVRKQSKP